MDLKKLKDEQLRRQAARDPIAFQKYVFGFEPTFFHLDWQKFWSEHRSVLIEAPRGHGKTSQVLARIAFEIGLNPNIRIKYVCQAEKKAWERTQALEDWLWTEKYLQVFPHIEFLEESKVKFTVRRSKIYKDATFEACGILSSTTGGRADLLVFDDVCDLRNSILFPALRDRVKQAYFGVYADMLEPEGREWHIFTPYHSKDLNSVLKKTNQFFHKRYPTGGPPSFLSIWPERFDSEELRRRYWRDPKNYERAYMLLNITDEDLIFKEELFEKSVFFEEKPKPSLCSLGLDLGHGRKGRNETAIVVLGTKDEKIFPLFAESWRVSAPEVLRSVKRLVADYNVETIVVESNAFQIAMVEFLKEAQMRNVNVFAEETKAERDTILGIPAMSLDLEKGDFLFYNKGHSSYCQCPDCKIANSLRSYPETVKDIVIATWLAWKGIKKYRAQPKIILLSDEEI